MVTGSRAASRAARGVGGVEPNGGCRVARRSRSDGRRVPPARPGTDDVRAFLRRRSPPSLGERLTDPVRLAYRRYVADRKINGYRAQCNVRRGRHERPTYARRARSAMRTSTNRGWLQPRRDTSGESRARGPSRRRPRAPCPLGRASRCLASWPPGPRLWGPAAPDRHAARLRRDPEDRHARGIATPGPSPGPARRRRALIGSLRARRTPSCLGGEASSVLIRPVRVPVDGGGVPA